jgi:1-acyl-sn-glycerol-3-phosphate acyltransferase
MLRTLAFFAYLVVLMFLTLFPEGTRSRGRGMARFKPGSMKLAQDAEAPILPVTIDGTYRLFEQRGVVAPTETVSRLSRRELAARLEETIREPLEPLGPQ